MSLTSRIAAIGAIGSVVFMLVVFMAVRSASDAIIRQNVDTYLSAYADVLVPAIRLQNGRPDIASDSGVVAAIPRDWQVSIGSTPYVRSAALSDWLPLSPQSGKTFAAKDGQRRLLVHQRDYLFAEGDTVTVSFALEQGIVDAFAAQQRSRVADILRPVLLLAALLMSALLFWQVLAVSRPLRRSTKALDALARGQISRLPVDGPRELDAMARRINQLSDRAAASLNRYRQFAANLSHALKTPLTVMRSEAADATMRERLDELNRLVERHLKRAQIAGPVSFGDHAVDLVTVLQRLAAAYQKLSNQQIDLDLPERLLVAADSNDLTEVFGNLVENAQRFARSRIAIGSDGNAIFVDDDGPGLTSNEQQAALVRGTRLDNAPTGSGIGLAVSREIVELYGGALTLAESPLGGLRVCCTLPVVDADMP